MKPQWMLVVTVVIALMLAACGPAAPSSGGGQPAPGTEPTNPPAAPVQPQQPSGNNQSSGQSQPPAPEPTAELPEFTDVTTGLDQLDSYQSEFTMSFDGEEDGQPKQWQWVITEEFVKNPPAKRTNINMTGDTTAAGQGNIQSIEVGGKQYSVFGDMCAASTSADQPTANSSLNPSSMIGDIRAAQLLGSEVVNGIPTQHYLVNLDQYNTLGWTDAKSEAWIAQTGNFVVKNVFEATGTGNFMGMGDNVKGVIKWTYELKSVNQPIVIEPPANCGGAPDDIPIMADAVDESSFGEMTTYTSPSPLDVVVTFYKAEMTARGWAEQEGGMSAEGLQILQYKKDTRSANITITASGGETTVLISIQSE